MKAPSLDQWLKEAKQDEQAEKCGMYLFHNGVVRSTAKAEVRMGAEDAASVTGMEFHYNADKVAEAEKEAGSMPGIYYVRVWLNEGMLKVGDDIMLVLQTLVGKIKKTCVEEKELY